MIIKGGTVHIFKDDELPRVQITHAKLVLEVPKHTDLAAMERFISSRVGPQSRVLDCTFSTFDSWAKERAADTIATAQSHGAAGSKPSLRQRLTSFIRNDTP